MSTPGPGPDDRPGDEPTPPPWDAPPQPPAWDRPADPSAAGPGGPPPGPQYGGGPYGGPQYGGGQYGGPQYGQQPGQPYGAVPYGTPPGAPGWGPPPGYAGYGYPPQQTDGKAITALVLAIASWVLCPVVPAIIALVLASGSQRDIEASGGRLGGDGLNKAAKIISWINLGLALLAVLVVVLGFGLFATSVETTTGVPS